MTFPSYSTTGKECLKHDVIRSDFESLGNGFGFGTPGLRASAECKVVASSLHGEDFRGKYWRDLRLESFMFVFLNLGYEICKAPKEQRVVIWSIVCLWPSFEHHRGSVKR